MKNKTTRNILILAIAIIVLIVILFICGFRITYSPELENNWDAISGVASWAGVFTTFISIIYAISVPKSIANEQNRIALFEKRMVAYTYITNCYRFAVIISKEKDLSEIKSLCKTILDCNVDDRHDVIKTAVDYKLHLHMLIFLFPNIEEKDVMRLSESFEKALSTIYNEEVRSKYIKPFIDSMNAFKTKYYKSIIDQIDLN